MFLSILSPAVTLLVANLSKERVIIPKNKVLADEFEVQLSGNEHADVTLSSVSQGAAGENQPNKSPIEVAMANADKALITAQLASLESVLKKHSSTFFRGSEDPRLVATCNEIIALKFLENILFFISNNELN